MTQGWCGTLTRHGVRGEEPVRPGGKRACFLHPEGSRSRPGNAWEGNQGGHWPDGAGDSQAVDEEGERMSQAQLPARPEPGLGA